MKKFLNLLVVFMLLAVANNSFGQTPIYGDLVVYGKGDFKKWIKVKDSIQVAYVHADSSFIVKMKADVALIQSITTSLLQSPYITTDSIRVGSQVIKYAAGDSIPDLEWVRQRIAEAIADIPVECSLSVSASKANDLSYSNSVAQLYANCNKIGASFEWTGPNSFVSTDQNPYAIDPGIYIVVATSGTCTDTARIGVLLASMAADYGAVLPLNSNDTILTNNYHPGIGGGSGSVTAGNLLLKTGDVLGVNPEHLNLDSVLNMSLIYKLSGKLSNWNTISASDANYILAGGTDSVYVSNDKGLTWKGKDNLGGAIATAISGNGKYQFVGLVPGNIYTSNDYGETWISRTPTGTCTGISCSEDGRYVTAALSGGTLYVSADSGQTWVSKATTETWQGVAVSAGGTWQVAVVNNGYIYVSNDHGNTWVQKGVSDSWNGVSVSGTGKYMLAGSSGYVLSLSTDYGETWVPTSISDIIYSTTMTKDGRYQLAVNGGNLYYSVDYGTTWLQSDLGAEFGTWTDVDVSPNGLISAVSETSNGVIYTANSAFGKFLDAKKELYVKDTLRINSVRLGTTFAPIDLDSVTVTSNIEAITVEKGDGSDIIAYALNSGANKGLHLDSYSGGFGGDNDMIDLESSIYDILIEGSIMYVAVMDSGLFVYDISGNSLNLIDKDKTFANVYALWADDNFVYAACQDNGLCSYSKDGGGLITFVDQDHLAGSPTVLYDDVWGDGNYIYVAGHLKGVLVYTVDGSGNLTYVTFQDNAPGFSYSTHIVGANGYMLEVAVDYLVLYKLNPFGLLDMVDRVYVDGSNYWTVEEKNGVFYVGSTYGIQKISISETGKMQISPEGTTRYKQAPNIVDNFMYYTTSVDNKIMRSDYTKEKLITNNEKVATEPYVLSKLGDLHDSHITDSTLYIEEPIQGNYFDIKLGSYDNGYLDFYWQSALQSQTNTEFYVANNVFQYYTYNTPTETASQSSGYIDYYFDPLNVINSYFDVFASDTLSGYFELYVNYNGFYWDGYGSNKYTRFSVSQDINSDYFQSYNQDDLGNNYFDLYVSNTQFYWNGSANDEEQSQINFSASSASGSFDVELKGYPVFSADTSVFYAENGLNVAYSYNETPGTIRYNSTTNTFEGYGTGWSPLGAPPVTPTVYADGVSEVNDTVTFNKQLFEFKAGNSWVSVPFAKNLEDIQLSYTGKYQLVTVPNDSLYLSSDYGKTWKGVAAQRYWQGASISYSGQYMVGVVHNGYVYVSNDYGETWTQVESTRYWSGCGISGDGKYMVALVGDYSGGGYIYVSSDFGQNWVQKGTYAGRVDAALSADGKYQVASANGGTYYYRSEDYGETWSALSVLPSGNYVDIDISSDGRYVAIARSNLSGVYVSSDYGLTFEEKGYTTVYTGLSMSCDGKYLYAVSNVLNFPIYASSDFGQTWETVSAELSLSDVGVSGDGSIQTATSYGVGFYESAVRMVVHGTIEYSNDFSDTYNNRTLVARGIYDNGLISRKDTLGIDTALLVVSDLSFNVGTKYEVTPTTTANTWVSKNGSILAICTGSGVFMSMDYGVSWSLKGSFAAQGIAMSDNGQYQVALSGTGIEVSDDYGATWTSKTSLSAYTYKGVAVSVSGQYQTICVNEQAMYVSSDYGETWTAKETDYWNDVAMSDNGQYQVAVSITSNGGLWYSNDYGSNWTFQDLSAAGFFSGVDISSDGSKIVLAQGSGTVWISEDYGNTWSDNNVGYTNSYPCIRMSDNGSVIYIFNQFAFKSTDGGVTFEEVTGYYGRKGYMSSGGEYLLFSEGWYINDDKIINVKKPILVDKVSFFNKEVINRDYVDKAPFFYGSLTDGTPTNNELSDCELPSGEKLGSASLRGERFSTTVKDTDGSGLLYNVKSDGTNWFYTVMTQAL